MFKFFGVLLIILYLDKSLANFTELVTAERNSRSNLVSFKPLGEHIALGLDFLLPFIKVPITRKTDANGNEPALLNINTAALVSTGLLATSSALVSYIFRKYVILGRAEKIERSDNDLENELWSALNNFKLVYRNSSGARVDTSLLDLFKTIDETFQKNDIDLKSCLQKAVCSRIQKSLHRVNEANPSGVDKIISGFMGLKWFRNFLRHTFLNDSFELVKHSWNCDVIYPKCKWSMPEENLVDIIATYLKFA